MPWSPNHHHAAVATVDSAPDCAQADDNSHLSGHLALCRKLLRAAARNSAVDVAMMGSRQAGLVSVISLTRSYGRPPAFELFRDFP